MKQIWITRPGPPEVLTIKEAADPTPGPGEVRIDVVAIGINFADLSARVGLYPDMPKMPCVVGYEVSGKVDAVGEGVTKFAEGDRVVSLTHFGGYSTKVCVPVHQAEKMPDEMSFEEGAALLVNYLTAQLITLESGPVHPGARVLVHSAAGGVGLAVIDLLEDITDIEFFGTASATKHDFLRERGVQHPIDYRTKDYAEEVRRLTNGEGVDLVLDALGGTDWKKGYNLLRPLGRLVAFGFANAVKGKRRNWFKVIPQYLRIKRYHPMDLMDKNRAVVGVNLGHLWEFSDLLERNNKLLIGHFEAGRIKPRVDKVFPFEECAAAHQYIHDRKNIGKVVLKVGTAD